MPVCLFKPIKPARFDSEASTKILIERAEYIADQILLDFLLTVSKWDHEVEFDKLVSRDQSGISILIGTDDEIYRYVDKGTEEHYIFPKGYGYPLRFQEEYKAKTIPDTISSRTGGPFGETTYRAWVLHPGNAPRNFEKSIAKKWGPKYKAEMEKAMPKAAQASKHGI